MRDKVKKKERIIGAAARVFAQNGFNGTLMADIAARAGVGKGTVYEYFNSKEDLFFEVFEWFVRDSGEKAKADITTLGGSVCERLQTLGDSIMHTWVDADDLFKLVMEFWSASASSNIRNRLKEAFKNAYRDFRFIVSTLIREGIESGEFRSDVDTESVSAALVGTWDALLLQAWFDESFDPMSAAKNHMAVIIRGLRSEQRNSP
jgi:AcrR family transcriptional regulator